MKPTPPGAQPDPAPGAVPRLPGLPPLAWQPLGPPQARLGLYVVDDPDALLDGMDDASFQASDERMPYWALLWPSGEALARHVLEARGLSGKRVLDLGCGVAPEGLAAARQGARVTCLDWAPEPEPLVRLSAERLGVSLERFVVADWRTPPAGLGTFDLVLGADVLYEARNAEPVAAFLAVHLAHSGEAWLADPGRLHARDFPAVAARAGLVLRERQPLLCADPEAQVTLWRYARAGGAAAPAV